MKSLINKKACRKFLLEYAERSRHHKFTRVSQEAFDFIETALRTDMRHLVDSQPSKGKTIK